MAEQKIDELKISEEEANAVRISNSADRPNAFSSYRESKKTAADVKKMFDAPFELLREKHDKTVDELRKYNAAETEREAAETEREEAETERANAEQERKTAEITRDEKIDEIYEAYKSGQLKGDKGDKGDPGSVNLVQTTGDSEKDAMSQKATTDAITELATSQKMLVLSGDFSGERLLEIKCNIPAGTYNLHIDSIESSDTDSTISALRFMSNGVAIFANLFARNTPIDLTIELQSPVDCVELYASDAFDTGEGDIISFYGLKITADSVLDKRIADLEKADLSQRALFENTTNALKGSASSVSPLVIEDVSPIPHTITVQASGGNKITRYGNNLINVSADTIREVNFKNENGWNSGRYYGVTLTLSAGTYTAHAERISHNTLYIYAVLNAANGDFKQNVYFVVSGNPLTTTFTADDGDVLTLYNAGMVNSDLDYVKPFILDYNKYQVEIGNTATPCMPYAEPAEYAVVYGVAKVDSLSHTTRIVSDTEGVTLEATYNRDINKAYAELVNAIIALGGNI